MVALDSHHYFESKHNFKTNVHSQMEWSVEIIEEPVEMCTFKTEAPARCIRGRRPYSFPTIKLKGYEKSTPMVIQGRSIPLKAIFTSEGGLYLRTKRE